MVSRRKLLQNGFSVASGCFYLPWALRAEGQGRGEAVTGNRQSWTLGNSLVERTVTYELAKGLSTVKFRTAFADYLTQGAENLAAPEIVPKSMAHEFSFECDGRACSGDQAAFTLLSASEAPFRNGKSLTVRLRHNELPLDVSLVYRVYDGHPAVRKHLVLKNTGTAPSHISRVNIESLALTLGPANEISLLTQYGTVPREIFYTGRMEDAGILVANGKTGNGIAVISEVPGCMKRIDINGSNQALGGAVLIEVMYDTDLLPFERTLAQGEEFTTAAASLVAFKNGDQFDDPHWTLPTYTAKVLERRVDEKGAPWIYNTWAPFKDRINHDTAMELIEVAGAMGMDIFTIDDGWQTAYGENEVNAEKFPKGLQPILDAVEAKGMRLGLWLPMAVIGKKTSVYRDEWVVLDQDGKPRDGFWGDDRNRVMCMATGYRDVAAARINEAIERFRLAYVKLDLTTVFSAYRQAPGCWARGHDHANWAESLNRIYEGISYVTARVYEKHPDVLLDLTFELWGQKHLIDAGLLAAGDLDWMSNADDTRKDSVGPLEARQLLYSHAATMPAEAMLIGNIQAELPTIEESFATAIGSAPLLLGDLRKLSAKDRAWYGERIGWFKKFRRQYKISESFFPLGSWQQTTSIAWDGFARFDRTGNGLIAIFRNESNATEAVVRLPLLPESKYKLHSIISGTNFGVFAGSDLAQGVTIPFPALKRAEVVEVTSEVPNEKQSVS